MATVLADDEKRALYAKVEAKLSDFAKHYTWSGLSEVARESSFVSVLHEFFQKWWGFVGFYRVAAKPDGSKILEIGPYMTGEEPILATPLINYDKGQCGLCAETEATTITEDVGTCPRYIACDEGTKSEMVCPVFAPSGEGGKRLLIAVLDLDSPLFANFNACDKEEVERLLHKWFFITQE